MIKKFVALLAAASFCMTPISCFAEELIATKQSHYLPELPPTSIATIGSDNITLKKMPNSERLEIAIPKHEITQLAITRNKNPTLSESIPGKLLSQYIVVVSNNNFEQTPVDGQLIVNGKIQSIKVTAFNFTPDSIRLITKAFVPSRPLKPIEGPGFVTINSSCLIGRVVCALGCTYVILPDRNCRKKLGIF